MLLTRRYELRNRVPQRRFYRPHYVAGTLVELLGTLVWLTARMESGKLDARSMVPTFFVFGGVERRAFFSGDSCAAQQRPTTRSHSAYPAGRWRPSQTPA